MRRAVFEHLAVGPQVVRATAPGLTWGGRPVPEGLSLAIVAVMGLA
jgi:hypothetical protein